MSLAWFEKLENIKSKAKLCDLREFGNLCSYKNNICKKILDSKSILIFYLKVKDFFLNGSITFDCYETWNWGCGDQLIYSDTVQIKKEIYVLAKIA